jgi:cation transport ATPase
MTDDLSQPSASSPMSRLESLLARPDEQRLREFKYRCAQAVIFGLPVIGLQYVGPLLGGPEAPRWIAILQALLAGWVVYVGAAGMLLEGLIVLPRRGPTMDLLVAAASIALYLTSVTFRTLPVFFTGHVGESPALFPLSVALIAVWSALRWRQFSGRVATYGRF